jgi:hypothetical protein
VASTAGIADAPQKVVLERRTSPQATTLLIEFDATLQVSHSSRVEVTDHPVEDGSTISDHTRVLPKRLTLGIVVSNDPVILLAAENAQPSVAGGDPSTRAQDALAELQRLQEQGQLVTVRTFLRDYDNMIIEDINAPRDAKTGNVLSASLSLRELIIATTELVDAPEPIEEVKSPRQNIGRQNTTAAPAENVAKTEETVSLLASILGG